MRNWLPELFALQLLPLLIAQGYLFGRAKSTSTLTSTSNLNQQTFDDLFSFRQAECEPERIQRNRISHWTFKGLPPTDQNVFMHL